jgi:hypothetical protein
LYSHFRDRYSYPADCRAGFHRRFLTIMRTMIKSQLAESTIMRTGEAPNAQGYCPKLSEGNISREIMKFRTLLS